MRNIKFRAKELKTGNWIKGDYTRVWDHGAQESVYIDHYIHTFSGYDRPKEIDEKTLGQFTGLKDRNELECWEGDRILFNVPTTRLKIELPVVFMDGCFGVELKGAPLSLSDLSEDEIGGFEVIGNIYENSKTL